MKYTDDDLELMKKMADGLEGYLKTLDSYIIIRGVTKEQRKKAIKRTKKLIKRLRKGKGDKVFDEARFREAKAEGKLSNHGV